MTLKEVMRLAIRETHRKCALIPVPFGLVRIKAAVLGLFPHPMLTIDQVRMLERDNVVSDDALTLRDLGIAPTAVEAILPSYLWRFRKHGEFETVST